MTARGNKRELFPEQREKLPATLKARFEKNIERHEGVEWAKVQAKLNRKAEKLWSLNEMERTGGEPDVVAHDNGNVFVYHNGAQSYYAARGFRGSLRV